MRVLTLEMRRTWLRWTVVPVSTMWLWMILIRRDAWSQSWIASTSYATAPVSYAVIVLSTVVGVESARRSRSGLWSIVRCFPRPAVDAVVARLAAVVTLGTAPLVVVLGTAWAITRVGAPPGWFDPGYLGFALLILLMGVSTADLVGQVTRSSVVGAVLGATVGLVVGFFGGVPLSTAPDMEMSPARIVMTAIVTAISLSAAVMVPVGALTLRRAWAETLARGAAGVVVGGVVLATIASGPAASSRLASRPMPAHPACGHSTPRVCVWPDHAGYLPVLNMFAQRADAAGQGVLTVPSTFDEFGLHDRDGTYSFKVIALGPGLWWTAGGMADTMLNAATVPHYCDPANEHDGTRRTELTTDLEYWLQARIYRAGQPKSLQGYRPDTSRVDVVLGESAVQQETWARSTLRAILATPCAP